MKEGTFMDTRRYICISILLTSSLPHNNNEAYYEILTKIENNHL